MSKQREIDFTVRGERQRLLDRVQLPELPGTRPAAMLAVLRQLDEHTGSNADCWPSVARLVTVTGLSRAAIYRALAALESLYLIDRRRTGRSNRYCICWGNLAEHDMRHQMSHHETSEVSPCDIRSRTVRHQKSHRETSKEETKEPTKNPPSPSDEWQAAAAAVAGVLSSWRKAIDAAQSAGVTPDYVLATVEVYHQAAGAWEPGALFERLRNAASFAPPDDPATWPPPRPPTAKERRAAELAQRVIAWHTDHDPHGNPNTTFVNAARSKGEFTDTEIARGWLLCGEPSPKSLAQLRKA